MSADPKPAWQTTQPPSAESAAQFSRMRASSLQPLNDLSHVTQAEFDECMGNVLDRLDAINQQQVELPVHLADAMATAMRDVLREPDTARALMTNMRHAAAEQAINATGNAVWATLKALAQKWLLIALLLFTLAGVAGWGPAVNAARVIFGPPGAGK